ILEGWLRALTAAALIPLFVLLLCAIELAMLSPLIDRMLADQAGGRFELDTVTPVALVVILFSIAVFASTRAAATIARGIRLPRKGYASEPAWVPVASRTATDANPLLTGPRTAAASPVARALESAARRDAEAIISRTVVSAAMRASRDAAPNAPTTARATPGSATTSATVTRPAPVSTRTRLPRASRAAARRDL
ncbi:MAG: hypothetical protein ABIO43_04975, partial [Sphingomicrobium sp.]